MKIPDFMTDSYNKVARSKDSFTKASKITIFSMFLMKYFSIIAYYLVTMQNYKLNKIQNLIVKGFYKPTDGKWLELLRSAIKALKEFDGLKTAFFDKPLESEIILSIQELHILLFNEKLDNNKYLNLDDLFGYMLLVKNSFQSHSTFNQRTSSIIYLNFIKIIDYISNELIDLSELSIILASFDNKNDCEIQFVSGFIDEDVDLQEYDEGLYLLKGKTTVQLDPFISCIDSEIVFFDSIDRKHNKVIYTNFDGVNTYKRRKNINLLELFGIDEISLNIDELSIVQKVSSVGTIHNLPKQDYSIFIGRVDEMKAMDQMVHHKRDFITALDGIGGVGKTAIALEYCYKEIENPKEKYDYIFWVSAKETFLKAGKITSISQSFTNLEQLIDLILRLTGFSEYSQYIPQKKRTVVIEILSMLKSLIIIDNLETISLKEMTDIWKFLDEIPAPNKILVTSRVMNQSVRQTLRINNLSKVDSIEFIKQYCSEMDIDYNSVKTIINDLVSYSSGLPIAIKSILGQFKLGKSFKQIFRSIENTSNNLAEFCFKEQLDLLKIVERDILLYLSKTIEPLDLQAVQYLMSDHSDRVIEEAIERLLNLSLIFIDTNEYFYDTLPLIKRYVDALINEPGLITVIQENLNDFYNLKDVESTYICPIEARYIKTADFIPKKLVDKAMLFAQSDEIENSDQEFDEALRKFPDNPYVLFMYAEYLVKYYGRFEDAISYMKKANQVEKNYIYIKKIGDYHYKNKNYTSAIKYYESALECADNERDKTEMEYNIAYNLYRQVKEFRKRLREYHSEDFFAKRKELYSRVIERMEYYQNCQPKIYIGKQIKIHRVLAECYYGVRDFEKAMFNIERAIGLSDSDTSHLVYRDVILTRMSKSNEI